MIPDIILLQEPFPHVIIKNIYSKEELKLIWSELDFLTYSSKFKRSGEVGHSDRNISRINSSQNYSLNLDYIYRDRKISDILTLSTKIADDELVNQICKLSPLVGHLRFCNTLLTKVKYYESGDFYRGHYDDSRFTFLTYLFKEPKNFTGGDLYFDDYDYTIEIENNMCVFFVGSVLHSSKELKLKSGVQTWTGNGKYTITQFVDLITDPNR